MRRRSLRLDRRRSVALRRIAGRLPVTLGRRGRAVADDRSGAGCGQGILAVRYEGERYVIPRESGPYEGCEPAEDAKRRFSPVACAPGRSMQSLSLVNQLISLQKSAKDLPGTGVIRTIGQ